MSTVLKAVQELERRAVPLTSPELPGADGYRITTWMMAAVALVLLMAVGVVARVILQQPGGSHAAIDVPAPVVAAPPALIGVARPAAPVPVPPVAGVAAPPAAPIAAPPAAALAAPRAAAIAAPLPAAAVVAPDVAVRATAETAVADVAVRSRADVAAPWGRVELPPAETSPTVETRPRPQRRPPAERATVRRAAVAPPETEIDAPGEDAPAEGAASAMNLPRVQVRAIVSGSDPTGRRVVLRIGGAPSVTLHEGESSDGVDVQFITEQTVYLRHRGNIFTVGLDR